MEVGYGATGASEAPPFKTQPTGYEAAERETADRGEDPAGRSFVTVAPNVGSLERDRV